MARAKGIIQLLHIENPLQFDLLNHSSQDHQVNFWSDASVQAANERDSTGTAGIAMIKKERVDQK
jgi:hypothetical protein